MAKADTNTDAEAAVKSKVSSVESEQGSFANAGGEPPERNGHDSAKSPGVGRDED